jgi:hypothetical protein
MQGARDVQLVLPETGVCRLDAVAAEGDACCGPTPVALQVGPGPAQRQGCC